MQKRIVLFYAHFREDNRSREQEYQTRNADANGYGLTPDTTIGTDKSLAAFEESYQNSVENNEKVSII